MRQTSRTNTFRRLIAPVAIDALVTAGSWDDEPHVPVLGEKVTVSGDALTIDDTMAFEIAADEGALLVLYPIRLGDDVDDAPSWRSPGWSNA